MNCSGFLIIILFSGIYSQVEADNLIRASGIGENSRRPFLVEVNWSLITDLMGSSKKKTKVSMYTGKCGRSFYLIG